MNFAVDLKILLLLFVANGVPILAKDIFDRNFQFPLDGGRRFFDGQPLLGHSKTMRGIFLSLVLTAVATPLVGLPWTIGVLIAGASMVGDVLSSFLKRRMRMPASSRAIGIDQIPEALFPLLLCLKLLALTLADVVAVAAAFLVCELLLSQLLYRLHLRDRPY